MFITAICMLFLLKLKWPKNKNFDEDRILETICRQNTTGLHQPSGAEDKFTQA